MTSHRWALLLAGFALCACGVEGESRLDENDDSADTVCKTADIHWDNDEVSARLGEPYEGRFDVQTGETFTRVQSDDILFSAQSDAILRMDIGTNEIDVFSELQFILEARAKSLKPGQIREGNPWTRVGSVRTWDSNWYSHIELNMLDGLAAYQQLGADVFCEPVEVEVTGEALAQSFQELVDVSDEIEFRARPHVKSGFGNLSDTYHYEFEVRSL
jgi:hypothetical protein